MRRRVETDKLHLAASISCSHPLSLNASSLVPFSLPFCAWGASEVLWSVTTALD